MQVSMGLIVLGIIIFTSNKLLDNEKLERLANTVAILSVLSGLFSIPWTMDVPFWDRQTHEVTPTVDPFADIDRPSVWEFTLSGRYSEPGYCPGKEFLADLEAGTELLVEFWLKTSSPDHFYAFEISGPSFDETKRVQGIDHLFRKYEIDSAGEHKILFSYCAEYSLNGTVKMSEGEWEAKNIEVKNAQ
jgi:hypothetical protein